MVLVVVCVFSVYIKQKTHYFRVRQEFDRLTLLSSILFNVNIALVNCYGVSIFSGNMLILLVSCLCYYM